MLWVGGGGTMTQALIREKTSNLNRRAQSQGNNKSLQFFQLLLKQPFPHLYKNLLTGGKLSVSWDNFGDMQVYTRPGNNLLLEPRRNQVLP